MSLRKSDAPLHVAFVCDEYPPALSGGIGPAVAALARGLAAAGHKVSVIGHYEKPSRDDDAGVTIYRLSYPRVPFAWLVVRKQLRAAIADLHRSQPIDIVEWPDYRGMYWSGLPGVTDVLKIHGTIMSHRVHAVGRNHGLRSRIIEILERRAMHAIPYWVGVSATFKEEWKTYLRAEPRVEEVVYNPVDTQMFRPDSRAREKLLLYCGGFRYRKGVLVLASALGLAHAALGDYRMLMMGFEADVSMDELRHAAGPAAARLEFRSFASQQEVAEQMRRAQLYVMPSYYESCGNTWLEAMASGTPVIGSTLSCGPEVITANETGLLANPNSAADVAAKLQQLLGDPQLAARLGKAARHRAEELFSVEVGVMRSLAFYRRVLEDAARGT
jgi:glycosyltransferase involved in cell wall biosynthesis